MFGALNTTFYNEKFNPIWAVYGGKRWTKQSLSITLLKFNNTKKKKYSGNYNKATYPMNIEINNHVL